MAKTHMKIQSGLTFKGQSAAPSDPENGDMYYDTARATLVQYINSKWTDVQSRTDVATGADLTSTQLTALAVQSSIIRLTGATTTNVHGLSAAADAKMVLIYNQSSAALLIKNASATEGTATNRILTSDSADLAIAAGQSVLLGYDSAQGRWIVMTTPGSGSGSDINYILNPSADASTNGWSTYSDAAGAVPVDGTGGSPNVTWTRTTSTPLRKAGSFLFTKDAVNRQGQGVSYDFTIDVADKARILTIEFDYIIGSGTFVPGTSGVESDLSVYIYDVTNAALIYPAAHKLESSSTAISAKFQTSFQTAYNSTSYRLIFHCATTSASAYTVKIDNVVTGPSRYIYGSPVTDSTSYTPVLNSNTSVTMNNARWTRVGEYMMLQGGLEFSGAGDNSSLTVALPPGYSIDTTKIGSSGVGWDFGFWGYYDNSGSAIEGGRIRLFSSTVLTFERSDDHNVFNTSATAVNDGLGYNARMPIVGWSSSVLMSNQNDTRVVAFSAYLASNTAVAPNGDVYKLPIDTAEADTHGGFDTSTKRYNIQVPGYYVFEGHMSAANTNVIADRYDIRLFKNGSTFAYGQNAIYTVGSWRQSQTVVSAPTWCNVGDYIEAYIYGAGNNSVSQITMTGGSGLTSLAGHRLSGPSAIAATEMIIAQASGNPASATSGNPIIFPTTDFDSHGGYNASTGRYSCPAAGYYRVSISAGLTPAAVTYFIYKNAVIGTEIAAGNANMNGISGTGLVFCAEGDIIDVRPNATADISGGNIAFERLK